MFSLLGNILEDKSLKLDNSGKKIMRKKEMKKKTIMRKRIMREKMRNKKEKLGMRNKN